MQIKMYSILKRDVAKVHRFLLVHVLLCVAVLLEVV